MASLDHATNTDPEKLATVWPSGPSSCASPSASSPSTRSSVARQHTGWPFPSQVKPRFPGRRQASLGQQRGQRLQRLIEQGRVRLEIGWSLRYQLASARSADRLSCRMCWKSRAEGEAALVQLGQVLCTRYLLGGCRGCREGHRCLNRYDPGRAHAAPLVAGLDEQLDPVRGAGQLDRPAGRRHLDPLQQLDPGQCVRTAGDAECQEACRRQDRLVADLMVAKPGTAVPEPARPDHEPGRRDAHRRPQEGFPGRRAI